MSEPPMSLPYLKSCSESAGSDRRTLWTLVLGKVRRADQTQRSAPLLLGSGLALIVRGRGFKAASAGILSFLGHMHGAI